MTQPANELRCSIARFTDLHHSEVVEQIDSSWDQFISWLEREPTEKWKGSSLHPGWSPVTYDPASRARNHVKRVYGLVIDYDKNGSWDTAKELWREHWGLIYTTKSHDVESQRFRVVLPLIRAVTGDEYDQLWRWADQRSRAVGLVPDANAKDASRFWYNPTPPPGGWRAERLLGMPTDPDPILALLEPPKLRIVHPPASVSTDAKVRRASAYLARIAPAVSGDSGHTTTFNAVAHVMVGFDLDPGTTYQLIASEYNPRCDPPWSEKELKHKIQSVAERCERPRGYLLQDRPRIETREQAAAAAPAVAESLEVDWYSMLLAKDGKIKRGYHNVLVFVRHFPEYRGKWSMDTMTNTPWFDGAPLRETLVHDIRAHADRRMGFTPSPADVEAAIATAALDRPFHPIQQYLRSVDWDGEPRLSSMARDYLGSDEQLHAIMVRKFMIGAAARALRPGCKLDTALMLFGEQGYFKSTFFAILGGLWHADTFVDITNKDSFVQIHSAWIYELSELENVVTGRAESRLKAWITSTHDSYRAPYSRTVTRKARGVAICGTTNRREILTDDTGSRRFWIVPVARPIPRYLLAECRDQLWAEAVAAYEAGEPWWLDDETERSREAANAEFHESDSWHDRVAEYLAPPSVVEITVGELLEVALKIEIAKQGRWEQMRVSRVLRELGWKRVREARPPRRWKYIRGGLQMEVGL
jgi:hypothetical protein